MRHRLVPILAALVLAYGAKAETPAAVVMSDASVQAGLAAVRPVAREDMALRRASARTAHLRSARPAARPPHMVRYPVDVIPGDPPLRPALRPNFVPDTRWGDSKSARMWARATMAAVGRHGLDEVVPRDIEAWCPAYPDNPPELRRAFWVGMMSALTKHESTHKPSAVGGGGRWFGLLQIGPGTAESYGCRATSGQALKDPILNLACAARIMGRTVARDRAVALRDGRWRGVAADWGPMTKPSKIAEMSAWTRQQEYCVVAEDPRPRLRPDDLDVTAEVSGG